MIRECAKRFSPIFFPEDSTSVDFELAGLLARLAFCGLPVPQGTVAEVAKALQRLTAAGTAPVSHRIPFSDALPENRKSINQDATKVGNKWKTKAAYLSEFSESFT